KEGVPLKRVLTHETLSTVAADLRLADVTALYAPGGERNVGAQTVVRRVIDLFGGDEGATEDLAEGVQITGRRAQRRPLSGDPGVLVKSSADTDTEVSDVLVKLSKCCTPMPGDDILGFVTRGSGVSVHRVDCTNAASLRGQPERLGRVEGAPTGKWRFLVNNRAGGRGL